MWGRIEKGFMVGLGLFALSRDKARSVVDDLARRSGLKDLIDIDKLAERGEGEHAELKEKLTRGMNKLISEMGFATRADIESLTRKVGVQGKKAKTA